MLTPENFYLGHYDAGDPFGNVRPSGNKHLGSDFNGLASGTEIPSFCDGTVSSNGYNSAIGNYLAIRTGIGWFFFYHMRSKSPRAVGQVVKYGELLGWLGNTGSTSMGAHLHVGYSPIDPTPGTGNVADPMQHIRAVIKQHSGTGAAELPSSNNPEGEWLDMVDQQTFDKSIDRIRREIRVRLFECSDHPGEYLSVDEKLPSTDPAKIGFPRDLDHIKSLDGNYLYLGDDEPEAKVLNHERLKTVIRLARGTDSLFSPSAGFAEYMAEIDVELANG